jgi:predicted ATPase
MLCLMMLHQLRREIGNAEQQATALLKLSIEHGFTALTTLSAFIRAWARSEYDGSPDRVAEMHQALADTRASRVETYEATYLTLLGERLAGAQQADAGLNLIEDALVLVGHEGRRWYEADVHRMKGELLLKRDATATKLAEECFRSALEIARRQGAKSFELRAATSLARLLANQGHRDQARTLLTDIYNWFTEGFDTADLKDAKALLDEFSN